MKNALPFLLTALAPLAPLGAQPSVTIYNQNFAVVRDTVPLDLKQGVNSVQYADTTACLEPTSVILRDPSGKVPLQILEQNYRRDPITQARLLAYYEGKTIDFETIGPTGEKKIVQGKIIRSGYLPPSDPNERIAHTLYNRVHGEGKPGYIEREQPIIEVEGKLRFSLPGLPLFPALPDESLLKPTLTWQIEASSSGRLDAELAYVTGQIKWQADYILTTQEKDDVIDVNGWVSISNQSGKTFKDAIIKLIAGDVEKLAPNESEEMSYLKLLTEPAYSRPPSVEARAFDEFYLYSLPSPLTLRDNETKQVQFMNASGVKAPRIYIYEGLMLPRPWESLTSDAPVMEEFENGSTRKVMVFREIKNSEANHLGKPFPKGLARVYRQDRDYRLEFTGESAIAHTAKNETLRLFSGYAFDLMGERVRTTFRVDRSRNTLVETVEIKLRNHKKEAVEIEVIEPIFRTANWEITGNPIPFTKISSNKIKFRVDLAPNDEKLISYTATYTW